MSEAITRAEMEDLLGRFATRIDARFDHVETRLDQVDARFGRIEAGLDQVDARFGQIETRLDQIDARQDATDARINEVESSLCARIEKAETTHLSEFFKWART